MLDNKTLNATANINVYFVSNVTNIFDSARVDPYIKFDEDKKTESEVIEEEMKKEREEAIGLWKQNFGDPNDPKVKEISEKLLTDAQLAVTTDFYATAEKYWPEAVYNEEKISWAALNKEADDKILKENDKTMETLSWIILGGLTAVLTLIILAI